jgi:hypothetical protein
MIAVENIRQRLRRELDRLRPRRIDLDAKDSAEVLAEVQRQNDRLGICGYAGNKPTFKGVPLRLDCPETRFVRWDDYEQLQVLSATCFTPEEPK